MPIKLCQDSLIPWILRDLNLEMLKYGAKICAVYDEVQDEGI